MASVKTQSFSLAERRQHQRRQINVHRPTIPISNISVNSSSPDDCCRCCACYCTSQTCSRPR